VSYTGRAAACELWGLCARPPAIEIGRGGLGLAHCRLGSVEFVVMIYRNQPPRYPDLSALRPREARRQSAATSVSRASYFALKAVVGAGASDAASTFAGE
jgi:hypothetical protein